MTANAPALRQTLHAICAAALLIALPATADPQRIDPPNWWAGMQNPNLQLMVQGEGIANLRVELDHPAASLRSTTRLESPDYLFLGLHIDPATTQANLPLRFYRGDQLIAQWDYPLKTRQPGSANRQGFTTADVIYLITPDRFANADPSNDAPPGFLDKPDRTAPQGRHGGDLQGITANLDYLADLGFTQLWLNPVLQKNRLDFSYHGYAATDLYEVDARFGGTAAYLELSAAARQRGIGLIKDLVPNFVDSNHPWVRNPPASDWLNPKEQNGKFQVTNHSRESIQDPHAAEVDRELMKRGWFHESMPDLNHDHPQLATYLLQNAIWWIETANLSGLRVDTWPYGDKHFMAWWTAGILREYPNLNIVGEEWSLNPALLAYWQRGGQNADGYRSTLPTLFDFPLQQAVIDALNAEKETWDGGLIRIYQTLASDFLYPDPFGLVTKGDNHDMSRLFTQLGERPDRLRMALTLLFTTRGIPQILYGTEILMSNAGSDDHGVIRSDYPGGWRGDQINAFTGRGLTAEQKQMQKFFRQLLGWRKTAKAIHHGTLTQYAPVDGVYVYFRETAEQRILVALNNTSEPRQLDTDRLKANLAGTTRARNVLADKKVTLATLKLPPKSAQILELLDTR
ncbi:MAG: glycoside hydrolase family 13 protein [Cellvibrionales bacterium]|nr:glycoside hydrolase family 13 protein [Cellvibrionales bacterium]